MNSEEPKIAITVDDDRISSLPDALLCHILSFLPTKYAVASSILSKRWKYLFASIPNIDLDDSLFLHPQEISLTSCHIFMKFVYRVLLLRIAPQIHKFRLKCNMVYENAHINAWIDSVLLRNVRELVICVAMEEYAMLPHEILTCKTLEVLKIYGRFVLSVPRSVLLPNLKVLHLDFIKLTDDDSVWRVFSCCPKLEDMSLYKCTFDSVQVLDISIPSLKKLTMQHCYGDHKVILDTPNLENLVLDAYGGRCHLVKKIKSLVRAEIDCGLSAEQIEENYETGILENSLLCCQTVANLVRCIALTVKSLHLSCASLEALYHCHSPLPTFLNLTIMELGVNHICGWRLLPDILESSPSLELLVFHEGFTDYNGPENEYGFEYCLPENVPLCLLQHLREIIIREFDGLECEFELVEYFLKSGQVLKKMTIGSEVSSEWITSTSKRLSEFPRCSKTCQIVLTWKKDGKFLSRILN